MDNYVESIPFGTLPHNHQTSPSSFSRLLRQGLWVACGCILLLRVELRKRRSTLLSSAIYCLITEGPPPYRGLYCKKMNESCSL